MKNTKEIIIYLCFFAAIILVIVSIFEISNHYLSNSSTPTNISIITGCKKPGINHTVSIKNDLPVPIKTAAILCDTLTITDTDSAYYLIAFGPHEHHVAYDGITEKLLSEGQSLTITLNQLGTYHFHDHLRNIVQGYFTISSKS